MLKFAANLSMMFNEVPFLDRFSAAADAGFRGVEYLYPYDFPAEAIAEQLHKHHLENVLFNIAPGNWPGGERGMACIPGREAEFRQGVETAISYATLLKTSRLHPIAGIVPAGADPAAVEATYFGNLRYAAEKLAAHGITLLVEAINTRDIPGFYVTTQAQSYAVCAALNAPNVRMQIDMYQMQVQEGDLAMKLRKYAPHCAHMQLAGAPMRREPDEGEVNYAYLFGVLEELGYDGWIGCEYRPAGKTVDGLGWFRRAVS
jgi:hydroxypyruvate isomerase